jgi:transposase
MMGLFGGAQVVMATEPVDLRRGHDGLVTLVRTLWNEDPYGGTLFVFLGRRRDRIKVLFFRTGGFVLVYKRLERGRFTLPEIAAGENRVSMAQGELAMLLDGVDLKSVSRALTWSPSKSA